MRNETLSEIAQAEGRGRLQGHWRVAMQVLIDEVRRYMGKRGVLKKMISATGVIVVLLVLAAWFK